MVTACHRNVLAGMAALQAWHGFVAPKGIGFSLDLGMDRERLGCSHNIRIATGVIFKRSALILQHTYSLLIPGAISEDSFGCFEMVMAVRLDEWNAAERSD